MKNKNTIETFLEDLNSKTLHTQVVLDRDSISYHFRIVLKDDPFMNVKDAPVNVNNYFFDTITALVSKYFNKKPTFNNTGNIFWF